MKNLWIEYSEKTTWIMMDTLDILNMFLEDKEITLLKQNEITNRTNKNIFNSKNS